MNVTKILVVAILLVSSFSNAQIARLTKDRIPANAVKATYYYLPEVESYYDIRNKRYIYAKEGKWFNATRLPAKYKSYNFNTSRKIVLTDRAAPYRNFTTHKSKFLKSTTKKRVVRPGNSGRAPGHNKAKHHGHKHDNDHGDDDDDDDNQKHHGRGHGDNDSKHGGKHNKK